MITPEMAGFYRFVVYWENDDVVIYRHVVGALAQVVHQRIARYGVYPLAEVLGKR